MKTPKEEARDLFVAMRNNRWVSKEGAIECSATCVDKILNVLEETAYGDLFEYWVEVKKEIKKL